MDAVLSVFVMLLVPASWLSAGILWHAALQKPRIGALTERAIVAVAIAVMVSTGGMLTLNRTAGYYFFPLDVARIIFSLSVITIGAVPLAWTVLWLTGRLGEGKA